MLRIRTHLNGMYQLNMRTPEVEQDALEHYKRLRADPKMSKKKLLFNSAQGKIEIEIANIKSIELIKESEIKV